MPIQPKLFDAYYASLASYRAQGVTNELGLRAAFATLLEGVGKSQNWTLVQEQTLQNRARPDGTMYDAFRIPRGYWEAKDSGDDLDREVRKKFDRGYPRTNIIFEDTRRGVLYQNGQRVYEADLANKSELAGLLQRFLDYSAAQVEEFHRAVRQFQDQIPELARGLEALIEEERSKNQKFVAAFAAFEEVCRSAINPNISVQAIEEMLVQHLLTERLFRTVFGNEDFSDRNVIASEIEKVIRALTSRSFSRREYLKQLDHFYLAIEDAARTIDDWSEKQGFLNTVYERFFQGFSKKQADTHGIVYTPQPIVDFMVNSVEEVLNNEFGTSLSTPGVKILDPCTGTGNFVVNILRRINRRDLRKKYAEDLFANEVMLLPYYIASLNIEHAYYELTKEYAPFEGIVFADTLDLAEDRQMNMFSEENTERVEREKNAAITVIIGNPPYNVGQLNENDNNKNRKYKVVDERIAETYVKDSKATLRRQLYDAYVRFFRWAADRLRGQDGIVCYVSNNSFVDQLAFDGMRKWMAQDFDQIYHLDLHGNVRQNPKLSGTTHNVFGIQVGVGITVAVRNSHAHAKQTAQSHGTLNEAPAQPNSAPNEAPTQPHVILNEAQRSEGSQSDTMNNSEMFRSAQHDRENGVTLNEAPTPSSVILNEAERSEGSQRDATNGDEMFHSVQHDIEERRSGAVIRYHRVSENWRKSEKLEYIAQAQSISGVAWQTLTPDAKQTWITEGMHADFEEFLPLGKKLERGTSNIEVQSIFKVFSPGVSTQRDAIVYDFDTRSLFERVSQFATNYNSEVLRWINAGRPKNIDDFLAYDRVKWSENLKQELRRGTQIHTSINKNRVVSYRPFSLKHLYYDDVLNDRPALYRHIFPTQNTETENVVICLTDAGSEKPFMVLTNNRITDWHFVSSGCGTQCFPFYTYNEDGTNRRENITDWALSQFRAAYGVDVTKRDIFNYVYALLHHPQYREKYKENLKRELPRIPLVGIDTTKSTVILNPSFLRTGSVKNLDDAAATDSEMFRFAQHDNEEQHDALVQSNDSFQAHVLFRQFVEIGAKLADLHLNYESAPEYALQWNENKSIPFSWRVEKMKLTKDKDAVIVNESLTLAGMPPQAFEYRLGNRSALEWVIDQYQVSTDKRSGITSNPNRADDEEYIVRLVGRVVHVSVETVKLVGALPPLF